MLLVCGHTPRPPPPLQCVFANALSATPPHTHTRPPTCLQEAEQYLSRYEEEQRRQAARLAALAAQQAELAAQQAALEQVLWAGGGETAGWSGEGGCWAMWVGDSVARSVQIPAAVNCVACLVVFVVQNAEGGLAPPAATCHMMRFSPLYATACLMRNLPEHALATAT